MPLLDSGAALFAGAAREFTEMAPASRLTAHLTQAFRSRWGGVTESEIRSWRNSLTALASVVEGAGLRDSGVAVELKLPLTDRRIDAFFVGEDAGGGKASVLVELKQWGDVSPSQFPDNVVVQAQERLHPSVQAGSYAEYLRSSHSAFTEDGFSLHACAYLHNMSATQAAALRGVRYAGAVAAAPFFVSGEEPRLGEYLQTVRGGDGMALLPAVLHGRYRPSMKLVEAVARSLKGSPVWTLLDAQRLAFNIVLGLTSRAIESGEKAVLICTGGPGTGKSVIAVHLLVHLLRHTSCVAAHATGSKAFTTNLRALATSGAPVFRYFNDFLPAKTKEDEIDVLVLDEAHRIRKSSNSRWTPKAQRSDLSQVEELMRAAKVSVFFLDQRQNVRPDEIGSVAAIEEAARRRGLPVHRVALDAQFRCNGCPAYVSWVDALFSEAPEAVGAWRAAGDYDLRLFERPDEMEEALRAKGRTGLTWRIVAGFCWPWTDPQEDGSLAPDVVIETWRRPWNEKSPEQRKPPGPAPRPENHPYTRWATMADRVSEVGCIYSAQGFEFDYCGVILGNDLVWRDGVGWVASRSASHDPQISRRKLEPEALKALIQQTYRVLMTRGMRGTFVTSTDWETRRFLESLLTSGSAVR